MVDLDYTNARTFRNKNQAIFDATDKWLNNFKNMLKIIFDDQNLDIRLDKVLDDGVAKYTFYIKTKNHEEFDFLELAHGYNSILSIVVELLLRSTRMDTRINEQTLFADIHGVTLIDEPEVHLHIKLQKKIMPMLVKFFPNMQFIVATHSPFVLNSLSNTVIYDVKTEEYFKNASDLSYDSLVEYHFTDNKFLASRNKNMERYEELTELLLQDKISETEEDELTDLDIGFEELSPLLSPNLYSQYHKIKEKLEK